LQFPNITKIAHRARSIPKPDFLSWLVFATLVVVLLALSEGNTTDLLANKGQLRPEYACGRGPFKSKTAVADEALINDD
jgi:ABC-type polysaccharide transport system permease subunit